MKRTKTNAVLVESLAPNSPLRGTAVEEGFEILAVNGEAVYSAKQVSNIVGAFSRLEFTAIKPTLATKRSPFCYVAVAPTSRIHPGISFDSCCGRCMVMISHVLVSNPEHTRLRVGDIVLAVNGVPVWKPEDADREQLKAARAAQALVLYCIDMDSLRDYKFVKFVNARGSVTVAKREQGCYEVKEGTFTAVAKVNNKTQLLEDKTDIKKVSYDRVCSMNEQMQLQLDQLKIKISDEAWRYAVRIGEDENDANVVTHDAIPPTPDPPAEVGIRRASKVPLATAFLVGEADSHAES